MQDNIQGNKRVISTCKYYNRILVGPALFQFSIFASITEIVLNNMQHLQSLTEKNFNAIILF